MRIILLLFTILLLSGYHITPRQNVSAQEKFKVKISYRALPNPDRTNYTIDNKKLVVTRKGPDHKSRHVVLCKLKVKNFDPNELCSFLKNKNWSEIPANLYLQKIDGYHYSVEIKIDQKTYNFPINTYHSTFDSLFTICNKLLPEDQWQEYRLPYRAD